MTETKLDTLLSILAEHHAQADVACVRRAYTVRQEAVRDRGEQSVAAGSVEAALALAKMRLGPPAVAAGLVAPLLGAEDDALMLYRESLGAEVAQLLDGVSRLARVRWDRVEEEAAESLRKMFLAMAQDVRVVIIVLANRVQLMRALRTAAYEPEEAYRIARETLDVFAPLANRLGIWQFKWELEDWSLCQLEPEAFAELSRLLNEKRGERDAFVKEVIALLTDKLAEQGLSASFSGRAKHVYSIYKKMQRKQVGFDQIYDVSAVRVITDTVPECYSVLGLVHSMWVPLTAEFDDYIARPKGNMYQSLHTAVLGPNGRPVEVQIRTQEMHQYAENGVAAHWAYKERRKTSSQADQKFMVLRQLMDWEREIADPHQFVESLKTDIFEDQVYVFTPNGDIIDLPLGSTSLDFAYRIHTEVGHRCRGARVNDQIQPLDYQLKTGDRVEILTQKQSAPSRDWMNPAFAYLCTASGRQKVRQWFRQQGRETAEIQGRELVDKELARLDLEYATRDDIAALLKYDSLADLYAAVGYGDRSQQSIASAALQVERDKAPPEEPTVPPSIPEPRRKASASGLSLDGVDDILGRRARCCNPVPGDDVVGFVSRGRGIMIHRRQCAQITARDEPERMVDIDWGPGNMERHPVDVEIKARDRPGLLRDLSNLISNAGVNMTAARAEGGKDGAAWLRLSLEFGSAEQVVKVLARIDQHPDVLEVRRRRR